MHYRSAVIADTPTLAALNAALITDEGHRNRMSLEQLEARMSGWLAGEYEAVLFEDASPVGYALFKREPEFVYLRQFFVVAEHRRSGLGRAAIEWLREHAWHDAHHIRLDVLVGNEPAIEFWRAVGFKDYCLTMECTC